MIQWRDTQLKVHLARLVELEYVITHRTGASFAYELAYDGAGQDGKPFVAGLIDIKALQHAYDLERSGQNGPRSGSGQPAVGPQSGGGRSPENKNNVIKTNTYDNSALSPQKMHSTSNTSEVVSYPQERVLPLAATASAGQ